MKRIAVLTAGGDTPALNATLHGVVSRANQLRIEVVGLISGFDSLFDTQLPHVHLNPLFSVIPELDPTYGGTLLGSSRRYVSDDDKEVIPEICKRLEKLGVEGLICVGGDGTMNAMQALCEYLPTILAPKTIDNDLGLNFQGEANTWMRIPDKKEKEGYRYEVNPKAPLPHQFRLDQMVNYVTPGYATSVFVSASGVSRIRTTAESHRRIAIIEVMGRHSGFLALGTAYGQPDIILLPEFRVDLEQLIERIKVIYSVQQNVVIVCGEGIVDQDGEELGASRRSTDPAGNVILSGAAEHLQQMIIDSIDDKFARQHSCTLNRQSLVFNRKVGHTQRGGRPLAFDRFHASQLGGKAVDLLTQGVTNAVATLQWNAEEGFNLASFDGGLFRDEWGVIHARKLHPEFYDNQRMHVAPTGIEYLLPIFTSAIGQDDMEHMRQTLFDSGNLYRPYQSINTEIRRRVRHLGA